MNQYPHVTDIFLQLDPKYQKVRIPHAHAGPNLIIGLLKCCYRAHTWCLNDRSMGYTDGSVLGHKQHYSNVLIITCTAQVIADTTRKMGAGMAKYIQQDVESIADYDEYCHFVAGLVGAGLSQASHSHQHFVKCCQQTNGRAQCLRSPTDFGHAPVC